MLLSKTTPDLATIQSELADHLRIEWHNLTIAQERVDAARRSYQAIEYRYTQVAQALNSLNPGYASYLANEWTHGRTPK